jgi:ankyrin repeat protein
LYALGNQLEDLALLLLDPGFDVNFRIHRKYWTTRMENLLVNYEIDENFERSMRGDSSVGLTPLHFTALNGISKMTAFLLDRGALAIRLGGLGGQCELFAIYSIAFH